jgi:hypothetical protein
MKLSRRRGNTRLSLEVVEVSILNSLLDELDELVEGMDAEDASTQRLFPAGYRDDREAAADFRELTEQALRDARKDRYGLIRAELPPSGGVIEITDETSQLWLSVLNDMRLVLGTRLGVSEELELVAVDGDPESAAIAIYHWLTALQDSLVRAVMR